jgi:hypothetical protein
VRLPVIDKNIAGYEMTIADILEALAVIKLYSI